MKLFMRKILLHLPSVYVKEQKMFTMKNDDAYYDTK